MLTEIRTYGLGGYLPDKPDRNVVEVQQRCTVCGCVQAKLGNAACEECKSPAVNPEANDA